MRHVKDIPVYIGFVLGYFFTGMFTIAGFVLIALLWEISYKSLGVYSFALLVPVGFGAGYLVRHLRWDKSKEK